MPEYRMALHFPFKASTKGDISVSIAKWR